MTPQNTLKMTLHTRYRFSNPLNILMLTVMNIWFRIFFTIRQLLIISQEGGGGWLS